MQNTTTPINTNELLEKLQQSSLTEEQKSKLNELMSQMTEDEKQELMTLLKKDDALKQNFEAEKQRQLAELNQKTNQELKQVSHHAQHEMRESYENFDHQQEAGNLKKVEEAFLKNTEEKQAVVEEKTAKKPTPKTKGGTMKFILALLTLAIVAGILMFALSNL